MEEFFSNKQNLMDKLDKLTTANKEIEQIKKERIKEQMKQNNFRENIIEKINEEKENFNAKNIIIEQDILNHERQYETIQQNNLDQIKYKRLLVILYKASFICSKKLVSTILPPSRTIAMSYILNCGRLLIANFIAFALVLFSKLGVNKVTGS